VVVIILRGVLGFLFSSFFGSSFFSPSLPSSFFSPSLPSSFFSPSLANSAGVSSPSLPALSASRSDFFVGFFDSTCSSLST